MHFAVDGERDECTSPFRRQANICVWGLMRRFSVDEVPQFINVLKEK